MKTRKRLATVLCVAQFLVMLLLPTGLTAGAVSGDADEELPTESMFSPSISDYHWTGKISRTDTGTGVRVQHFTDSNASTFQNWLASPVILNGTHLKMTFNTQVYNDRLFFLKLSSSGNNTTNAGLFYRIDLSGRQLSACIDDFHLGNYGIDYSGYVGYDSTYPDRVFVPSASMSSSIHQYEIIFSVGLDESITMTINGYAFTLPASFWKSNKGLTNLSRVYVGFGPANEGYPDYTLNLFHGGNSVCEKLIDEVNDAYTAAGGSSNIAAMTDLWKKMQALSPIGRKQVDKYLAIASAMYNASNAEVYKTVRADLSNYNSWGNLTYTEGTNGLTVNNAYKDADFAPWTSSTYDLDGFEMGLKMTAPNPGNTSLKLYFSNAAGNNSNSNKAGVGFNLYFQGGVLHQLYITGTEGAIDHSEYPGYTPSIATDRVFLSGLLTENNNEYAIKTSVNLSGDLIFRINNYQVTVPASNFSTKLTNTAAARIAFHPQGAPANYTIHYMRSGSAFDYDNCSILPTASDLEPVFKSHSLILAEEIGVNFYMDLSELTAAEKTGSYMSFEINNQTKEPQSAPYNNALTNEKGFYRFTCYVSSVQMAEEITPTFHYGDGKTVTGSAYSVKDYIDYVTTHTNSYTEKTVTLVKSLGDYGHYARIYLNSKNSTTNTAMSMYRASDYNSDDYGAFLAELNTLNTTGVKSEKTVSGAGLTRGNVTYHLNFDSTTTIGVDVVTASAVTATITDVEAGVTKPADVIRTETGYTIRIPDLFITDLDKTYVVSGTAGSATFTIENLSGLSYIRAILNMSENTNGRKDAMAAFYDYYLAAEDYIAPEEPDPLVNGEQVE